MQNHEKILRIENDKRRARREFLANFAGVDESSLDEKIIIESVRILMRRLIEKTVQEQHKLRLLEELEGT